MNMHERLSNFEEFLDDLLCFIYHELEKQDDIDGVELAEKLLRDIDDYGLEDENFDLIYYKTKIRNYLSPY